MFNKIYKILISLCLIICCNIVLVGCDNTTLEYGSINVYTRDTSSGTREGFFTAINASSAKYSDEYLIEGVSVQDSNGDMINSIKNDSHSIGYISLSSVDTDVLTPLTYDGVVATEENVLNGTYKMSRNFSYVTKDDSLNTDLSLLLKEFNNFVNSEDGQLTLLNEGVVVDVNKDKYVPGSICTKKSINQTILIGGSSSVSDAAVALSSMLSSKCGNFKAVHSHTGSSDSDKVYSTSNDMHIGFSSAGIRSNWIDNKDEKNLIVDNLGLDAIVVVVNKDNILKNITQEQLQQIYIKPNVYHNDVLVALNTINITRWEDLIGG